MDLFKSPVVSVSFSIPKRSPFVANPPNKLITFVGSSSDSWSFGISDSHLFNGSFNANPLYDNNYSYSASFVINNDRQQPSFVIDKQTAGSSIHIASGSVNPLRPDINANKSNHPTLGVASFVGINNSQPSESLHVLGNALIEGDITAQNYIVSSSVSYITTSFSSGSTVFGDDSGDKHEFTGSLLMDSSSIISSSGKLYIGDLYVNFNIDN